VELRQPVRTTRRLSLVHSEGLGLTPETAAFRGRLSHKAVSGMLRSVAETAARAGSAANGSLSPMAPSTWAPAACSSNGRASSSVVAASSVSGSQYGRGTSRVKLQEERRARARTSSSSLGVAAVR
jgi:hypothetical protein